MEAEVRQAPARWAGYLGIVGGLLWAAAAGLHSVELAQPDLGLSSSVLDGLLPAAMILFLFSLYGLHRVHRGRGGRLESWGYRFAMAGFLLYAFALVARYWFVGDPTVAQESGSGESSPVISAIGLLIFGLRVAGPIVLAVGVWRARLLPRWGRPLPALLGVGAIGASSSPVVVALDATGGVVWALLGLALAKTYLSAPAASIRRGPSLAEVRSAFLSRGTLISGVLAVGAWSLEWNWLVGVWVVLLLYAHELGHVITAFWRGIEVKRAPIFLPGFGAFVETGPRASAWDDAWISLGGPLIGGAAAIGIKAYGMQHGNPALAHAGDFALIVNLLNLAPFSPLDGGRVALRTGWLGLVLTLGLGAFLLVQGIGLLLSVLVVLGGLQAFASARRAGRQGLGTHAGIMAVYLAAALALLIAVVGTGRVTWLPSDRPAWLPSLSDIFEVVFWIWLIGIVAIPYAWRAEQTALVRYGILAVLGWPRYLLERKAWMIGVAFANLGQALGLPTDVRVESMARSMARRADPAAGAVAAYGFDSRVRSHASTADEWLERLSPALWTAGSEVVGQGYQTLTSLGYTSTAERWLREAAEHGVAPSLTPSAANERAWALLGQGRAEDALPLARTAVAGEPDNANFLDTLGQVLVALDQPAEAESVLRQALAGSNRTGTRVALARALAGQSRFDEAVTEASAALARHHGTWPSDEPNEAQIRAWVTQWQSHAGQVQQPRSGVLRSNI